jgi:hypothetical protein
MPACSELKCSSLLVCFLHWQQLTACAAVCGTALLPVVNPPNEQEAAEASKAARLKKGQQLPLVQVAWLCSRHCCLTAFLPAFAVNPPNEQEAAEASKAARLKKGQQLPLVQRVGLLAVRGAEVVEVRDEEGGLMNDFTGRVRLDERKPPKGERAGHILAGSAGLGLEGENGIAAACCLWWTCGMRRVG